MSAYIVDRDHISYLVAAAAAFDIRSKNWTATGQMLWDECVKSLSCRYPHYSVDELPGVVGEDYTFTDEDVRVVHRPINPVEALKAVRCYTYQSCEHDGWKDSGACFLCQQIESRAVGWLPGYEEASWGAPENWKGSK